MIDLTEYGFSPEMFYGLEGMPARVTSVHKERYGLACERGEIYGRLKAGVYYGVGAEEFPTAGDFVRIEYNDTGDSQIVKTLPRKSKFARSDFSGHAVGYVKTVVEQVVAANFDYVFIMQSLNHDLNPRRLERYLALSWQSGATLVVILTKADLSDSPALYARDVEAIAMGVNVHAVSAKTGFGMDALSEYLKPGKTIVFLGSSGVGKSSLVNALAGEELMAVKEIREDDSKGRHTTTHRQLIRLKSGVMIIDTPGMRELGMWDVSSGISETFADVERFLGKCKFSDCRHGSEPGCAIKSAIASGELPLARWESYMGIQREAKFSESKSAALREKDARFKTIAIANKNSTKLNKR